MSSVSYLDLGKQGSGLGVAEDPQITNIDDT